MGFVGDDVPGFGITKPRLNTAADLDGCRRQCNDRGQECWAFDWKPGVNRCDLNARADAVPERQLLHWDGTVGCQKIQCTCDTPNTGADGNSSYRCSNGVAATCGTDSSCRPRTPWFLGHKDT